MEKFKKIMGAVGIALAIIICLPFIAAGLLCYWVYVAVTFPIVQIKGVKNYKKSNYFRDFKLPYKIKTPELPQYIFYESAKKRNLPIQYVRQKSNGFEYFVYEKTVYIFGKFERLEYDEENKQWLVITRKGVKELRAEFGDFVKKQKALFDGSATIADFALLPVKMLVPIWFVASSEDFAPLPPTLPPIPEDAYIIDDYACAFERSSQEILASVPCSVRELYDMLMKTTDLCGEFSIESDEYIKYVRGDLRVVIGENYIEINVKRKLPFEKNLTHWHPEPYEIYNDVCKIAKRGRVMVVKTLLGGASVKFFNDKSESKYKCDKNFILFKIYYFEAK